MSESMVDRVAKAIADQYAALRAPHYPTWDEHRETGRNGYRAEARAAIAAMRDPDKAMLHAAAKAMSPGRRPTPERVSCKEKHRIRFQAMIDECLSDAPPAVVSDKEDQG